MTGWNPTDDELREIIASASPVEGAQNLARLVLREREAHIARRAALTPPAAPVVVDFDPEDDHPIYRTPAGGSGG